MSPQEIKISISSALNAAGIDATRKQIAEMSKSVSGSLKDMTSESKMHMADFKAGFDLMCGAIQKSWSAVTAGLKSAFAFETQTTQFKTLIGNIDEARQHMADLKELGDTPPFSLDEFARASRQMMVMTDGALGYKKSLELVGDAAAATGYPIEELGQAVGRMYAFIRDGQPLSRAVMQLRNMGVITPEVAQKLQDLQNAGKSNAEIWAEVEAQLGRYKGAMEATENTGNGLIGAIQTRWDNIVRIFGNAFESSAKGGMTTMLDKMKELEQSGTLEVWASRVAESMEKVVVGVKTAIGWASKLVNAYSWVKDKAEAAGSYWGGTIGAMSEGASLKDANSMGLASMKSTEREQADRKTEQKAKEDAIRKEVAARAEKAAEDRKAAEQTRIETQLREKQAAKDEADREKEREAEKKEVDKWLGEDNKEQLAEATKALADARSEAAKAEADVKSASEKLKTAIEKYNDNITSNRLNETIDAAINYQQRNNILSNVHGDVLKAVPRIGEEAGILAADKAVKAGNVRTVAQYDKIAKQAARDARIQVTKNAAAEERDAQRAARLRGMSDKAMSKADKDWLAKYDKVKAGKDADRLAAQQAAAEKAAAEKRKADSERAIVDMSKEITEINQRLANLGLK